jgi:hypothetical protein
MRVCKNTGLRRILEPKENRVMGGYRTFLNRELKKL